jgi:hypothetical protein
MRHIAARLAGFGCLGGVALALVIVGLLALVSELQSPTSVLWTGRAVVAQDRGGVVQYPVNGINYTLVVASEPASTPAHALTVYFDPKNPSIALADSAATRWFDASFVAGPFLGALLAVGAGLVRTRRRRRGSGGSQDGFGRGFDVDEFRARRQRVVPTGTDAPDRPG